MGVLVGDPQARENYLPQYPQTGGHMPNPTESLSPESSDEEIRKAIGDAVAQMMEEGFNQEQAVAIAFQQAAKATGKDIAPPEQSRSRGAV